MSATEPTIICPTCKTEIKLNESLAAPLVESLRRDYEERLASKDTDMVKRETALSEREKAIANALKTPHQCQLNRTVRFAQIPLVPSHQIQYLIINTRAVPLVRKDDAHQGRVFYFRNPYPLQE